MAGLGERMETSPAVKCLKFLMTIFNMIFFISGIAILALGIWLKVIDHYGDIGHENSSNPAWVLIIVGCVILLFGIAACCCTLKGISGLLYAYAILLCVIFLVEISVSIACFVMRDEIKQEFEKGIKKGLEEYRTDKDMRKSVDNMQESLECCGSADYKDWFNIPWQSANTTDESVPKSCCKDEKKCENTAPTLDTTDIYTQGCQKKVVAFMEKNFAIIGGVAIGFCFLMLFGAVLACCLGKSINKAKYQQIS